MKRALLSLLIGLAVTLTTLAEEPAKVEPPKPGASNLIIDALRGLSALLPKPEAPPSENTKVSTIGIRGSETTTTLVTPYWKDDRSNDPAFAAELSAFTAAQDLLQEQRWDEAQQALVGFMTEHPQSDLIPHAKYALALAAAGASRDAEAVEQLQQFARDYPAHPLRADAEKLAAALVAQR